MAQVEHHGVTETGNGSQMSKKMGLSNGGFSGSSPKGLDSAYFSFTVQSLYFQKKRCDFNHGKVS